MVVVVNHVHPQPRPELLGRSDAEAHVRLGDFLCSADDRLPGFNVLVESLRADEGVQRPFNQHLLGKAEILLGQTVEFQNLAFRAENKKADGRIFEEIGQMSPGVLQFHLRAAQLLVLHLQLDVEDVQFFNQTFHVRRTVKRLPLQSGDNLLGPLPQLAALCCSSSVRKVHHRFPAERVK